MAKVQLEAFQNKLRSDYIDWPDRDIGCDIKLFVDMSKRGVVKWMKPNPYSGHQDFQLEYTSSAKIATFEYTRTAGVYTHPDGNTEIIHLYTLVDVH